MNETPALPKSLSDPVRTHHTTLMWIPFGLEPLTSCKEDESIVALAEAADTPAKKRDSYKQQTLTA